MALLKSTFVFAALCMVAVYTIPISPTPDKIQETTPNSIVSTEDQYGTTGYTSLGDTSSVTQFDQAEDSASQSYSKEDDKSTESEENEDDSDSDESSADSDEADELNGAHSTSSEYADLTSTSIPETSEREQPPPKASPGTVSRIDPHSNAVIKEYRFFV